MKVKVQKQDGSTVECSNDYNYALSNGGILTSFPTGTTDAKPRDPGHLIFNLVSINNNEFPGQYQNYGNLRYGYCIEMSGFGDSAVQIFIPYLYSGLTYGHPQAPIYIRSTQDSVNGDAIKGWTAWRRIAFFDEI